MTFQRRTERIWSRSSAHTILALILVPVDVPEHVLGLAVWDVLVLARADVADAVALVEVHVQALVVAVVVDTINSNLHEFR